MRAIYTKELKELALAGLPLALLAIPVGWAGVGLFRIGDDLLVALLCGAGFLGIVQGVLDKLRTRETFLYHRPVARWRIELARTLAGATHVVFAAAVLLGTVRLHAAVYDPEWMHAAGLDEPTVLTYAQNALSVATALLVWAAVRLGFSFRRVPHILAWFLGYGVLLLPLLRREDFGAAIAVASATALLCALPVLALPRARRVALCAVTAWIVLGLTALGRGGTSVSLAALYPRVGIDEHDRVVLYRRGAGAQPRGDLVHVAASSPDWVGVPLGRTVFDRIDRREAAPRRRLVPQPVRHLLRDLNRMEPSEDGRKRRHWSWEDGRLVASDGTSFRLGRNVISANSVGSRYADGLWTSTRAYYDPTGRRLLVVRAVRPRGGDNEVDVREIALPAGDVVLYDVDFWQQAESVVLGVGERLLVYDLATGDLLLDAERSLAERPLRHVRAGVRRDPPRVLLASRVAGFDPTRHGLRIRIVGPDGARVHDLTLEPESAAERAIAFLGGSIAVLRPPLLNVASFAAPAAESRDAYYAWWLDVWFRGRKRAGWLLASVAVGLLCAWRARVQARVRLARGGRAWVALALLLGPLGLLWMRIFVPWVHVEEVAGERRAVNLDAPWPEPEPTGREILAVARA